MNAETREAIERLRKFIENLPLHYGEYQQSALDQIDGILDASPEPARAEPVAALPPGWVAVPVEMTEAMFFAGVTAQTLQPTPRAVFEAMLAAAPPRPAASLPDANGVDEYQEFIISGWRTKGSYPDNLTDSDIGVAGLGLAGEAGEAAEHVKKLLRGDGPINKEAFAAELGDVLAYVASNCAIHGLSMRDVMEGNVRKLTARRARWLDQSPPTEDTK